MSRKTKIAILVGVAVVLGAVASFEIRDKLVGDIVLERLEALPRHESFESETLTIRGDVQRQSEHVADFVMPWEVQSTSGSLVFTSDLAVPRLCVEYPVMLAADNALIDWLGYGELSGPTYRCSFDAVYDGYALAVRITEATGGAQISVNESCREEWSTVRNGCRTATGQFRLTDGRVRSEGSVAPDAASEMERLAPTAEQLAQLIVLDRRYFGWPWKQEPQSPADFPTTEGCEFTNDLLEDDGYDEEARSPRSSRPGTSFEQTVRIYPDATTAQQVLLARAQPLFKECSLESARLLAQVRIDSGELAPFTSVEFAMTTYDDVLPEASATSSEVTITYRSPEGDFVTFLEVYDIQVGRSATRLKVWNDWAPWTETDALLEDVVERMTAANEADTATSKY